MITKDDKEDNRFEIKISGSGTESEIIDALEKLTVTLKEVAFENKTTFGRTFEDNTLCTEITQIEE